MKANELNNNKKVVVTERGKSAQGNEMYFFHINKKERATENVAQSPSFNEVVSEPVVEYQSQQHTEYKGVEIPNFGQSIDTEYIYDDYTYGYEEYKDADFKNTFVYGSSYDHREGRRVTKEMHNKRCRKPRSDFEKFAKYKLGVNLDSVDKIKEGISSLFN